MKGASSTKPFGFIMPLKCFVDEERALRDVFPAPNAFVDELWMLESAFYKFITRSK